MASLTSPDGHHVDAVRHGEGIVRVVAGTQHFEGVAELVTAAVQVERHVPLAARALERRPVRSTASYQQWIKNDLARYRRLDFFPKIRQRSN